MSMFIFLYNEKSNKMLLILQVFQLTDLRSSKYAHLTLYQAQLFNCSLTQIFNQPITWQQLATNTRCGQNELINVKPSIRMKKESDSSHFKLCMVVGARRAVYQMIYWDFQAHPSLVFTKNNSKKRNHPVIVCSVGKKNAFLMPEENSEGVSSGQKCNSNSNHHVLDQRSWLVLNLV